MELLIIIELSGMALLLCLSAFFSGSETALTALSKLKVKSLIEAHGEKAEILNAWLEHPNRILTTILVGNNVANIGAATLGTVIILQVLSKVSSGLAAGLATFIVTILVLIFGEIIPKTFARQRVKYVSLKSMKVLCFLALIFSPAIRLLMAIANSFIRLLGGKVVPTGPFMTEEEMKLLISMGEEEGVLEEEEREMLHSIFEFGETKVQEIMVPRIDMVCIEENAELEEVLTVLVKVGHSRIPVYRDNADNITGMLYAKDLLNFWDKDMREKLRLKDFMRQPYFVPESKNVSDLLREFRKAKTHIAIVVDEYGGTAGLVTIEDILEEIVGEIEDEYDLMKKEAIKVLKDGKILIEGRMDIGEINEKLQLGLPEEEGVETIAGFIISLLGRLPEKGEEIKYNNLIIKIEEADKRRIIRVGVVRNIM